MISSSIQGVGLGLRFQHLDSILETKPKVPWFEVILEDFLEDGFHHSQLEKIREDYPIVFHSVGLNLGGVDPFDQERLKLIKSLYEKYQPVWISDHLCWSSHNGHFHHDLLPIPKTKEGLRNIVQRVDYLQNFFNRTLVVENITSYVDYEIEDFSEIDFIKRCATESGCELLLDITNVTINYKNRNLNPTDFFSNFPMELVKQGHLSGSSFDGKFFIDSHSSAVKTHDIDFLNCIYIEGHNFPVMIERDTNIPDFSELFKERDSVERKINEL